MADPIDPMPSYRRGGRRLFDAEEVDAWLRRGRVITGTDVSAIVAAIERAGLTDGRPLR